MKTKTIELRLSGSSSGTYPFLLFLNNEYDVQNAYDGFSNPIGWLIGLMMEPFHE